MLALPVELNVVSSVPLLLSRTTQKSSLVDGYVQPPANRIFAIRLQCDRGRPARNDQG